jgi:hypothetical protein
MRTYRFGPVTLHASLELPELPEGASDASAAMSIEECDVLGAAPPEWYHAWVAESGDDWLRIGRDDSGYQLEFPGLAQFAVHEDGRRIRACRGHASPETFRHLLLDQVLPLVLSHRGWCVLHAAAVAGPTGAAAFLGAAGQGKSTMTASLAAAGMSAVTDDTLILSAAADGHVTGHPAYPSIRMWPETAHAILGPGYRHDGRVSEFNDKVRVGPSAGIEFVTAAAPLRVLYVLAPDAETGTPRVESIAPRDRVIEVVRHAFVLDWQGTIRLRTAFDTVSRVVDRVAIRRLRFRHDYGDLPAVRDVILEDLRHAA